ncbi:hypothetical protein [Chitinophaga rhizophila]|uniref:Uncharacterized protein n=1 Tax=Chitinophaga rhizophila TaxID=2866212 RepID=A0ABS7G9U8_9BACT|nr:hypothetical protein [Chitinophaga rhizophila]MBW8683579.1 hypothetical protein [Chitinophaga rhizophila]
MLKKSLWGAGVAVSALGLALFVSCAKEEKNGVPTTPTTQDAAVPEGMVRSLHYKYVEDSVTGKGSYVFLDDTTLVPAPKNVNAGGRIVGGEAGAREAIVGNAYISILSKVPNFSTLYNARIVVSNCYEAVTLYTTSMPGRATVQSLGTVSVPTSPGSIITVDRQITMACGYIYGVQADTKSANPLTAGGEAHPEVSWLNAPDENVFPYKFYATQAGISEADGADIKIGNIDSDPRPDVLLMGNDDPPGANYFEYTWLMNINPATGQPATTYSFKRRNSAGNDAEGAGVAIGNINGNSATDIVMMSIDAPAGANNFRYQVGFDVNPATGEPTTWSNTIEIQGIGNDNTDGSVALADINGNSIPDIILMGIDGRGPNNYSVRYRIGFDLNAQGVASSWSTMKQINLADLGALTYLGGGGMDIAPIRNNGKLNLVAGVYHLNNGAEHFRTYIYDLDVAGNPSNGNYMDVEGVGDQAQGAGVAVGNLDGGTQRNDMMLMMFDNPSGPNQFRYYTFYNFYTYKSNRTLLSMFEKAACN